MSSSRLARGAMALALGMATSAHAATDADLEAIRNEIRQMKESYEARIRALEDRLKAAESAAAPAPGPSPAPAPASAPVAEAPAAPAPPTASGIAAFNPAISAVLQGAYINLSQDPKKYMLAGFVPSGDIAPGPRSFSIAESELNLSASVDHLFSAALTFSLSPENTVEVEEAYAVATALPYGITPKFGRFFSGLGYLNQQHQHAWDFYDAPLVYQAFFGGQYTQNGVQVKWVAPTDTFLELGAEGGSGTNFPGDDRNKNGVGDGVAYVHAGGDVGASNSWLGGLSYLQTASGDRAYSIVDTSGVDTPVSFTGRSRIAVADFVWKWAPNGNAQEHNFKLQGEYMWRRESGDLTYDTSVNGSLAATSSYGSRQSGFYVQGVWQFIPEWRVGVRYDWLDPGSVSYGVNGAYFGDDGFRPQRTSVMFDWTPSEFSRLRLQYSQAKLIPGITDNQWFLQYILTLGAHGAHRF
ncbi:MAG TPA: TonB-dependent receptor [Casimicrobiaceae bacterium]|nr:TonB-dependent receptor [Casimicrobiaceae bacterium]